VGASNALAAYTLYAGKIPPTSLNVLTYMALVSLDRDAEPSYWEGHEILAIRVLGYPGPVGRAGKGAVERAITPLHRAGAITTTRRASGHSGRVITARYRLWITEPAPHGFRGKQAAQHPTVSVGSNGQHPTVSVSAPHGNRGTEEEEEDLKQERDLRAGTQTSVDATRTGSARASDGDEGEIDVSDDQAGDFEAHRQSELDRYSAWLRENPGPAPDGSGLDRHGNCTRCNGNPGRTPALIADCRQPADCPLAVLAPAGAVP
jgi:hypothetical protein